jgi:chemotaxis signal transduction protein
MNVTARPMENISSLLTFQLGGQIFCTDMQNIVQIVDPSELNQDEILYSQDAHINLDSIKIPIIDLFKKADVKEKNLSKDNRILIINIDHNSYGIWVEKVDNIYTLGHDLDVAIEYNGNDEILFLKGILKFKNMKMLFLDLKGISQTEKNIN